MVPLAPAAHNSFFELPYLILAAHFIPGGQSGMVVLENALTEVNKNARPSNNAAFFTVKTPY